MVARCSIRGRPIADALYVPVEAVHTGENGTFVRVASVFGAPAVRKVEIGRSTARFVEVRAGLREGDRVRIGEAD
jgi:multidrug efflux pump subunit AcrA (membrane-fusion protein)